MGRADLSVNGDLHKEKLETILVKSGRFTQKETEEKFAAYSSKVKELSKENSFATAGPGTIDSDDEISLKYSRTQSYCGLLSLCLALVVCISGCYVMWGTDLFTLVVHQNLIISNNSMRYEAWRSPPVNALLRVYIFNYTNVEAFEKGLDARLKVEELGPYTYIEKLERVDVRFNNNGTATYRNKKTYKFSAEQSRGNESDIINVPNLPFLAAMALTAEVSSVFRWPLLRFLNSMGGQPFISLKVEEFLWGYEDRFSVLARQVLSFRYDLPFKKFGILSAKNGTQKDLVTIYTGEEDPSKTGIVVNYDGKTSLTHWNSQECNRIDGTDGTIYPPSMVRPNSTLYVYSKDFCRKIPLVYSKQYLDQHGIPVLRYHTPKTVFASGQVQKENLCFCRNKCLPSGLFSVAPCTFEAPLVTSLPHFLYGDPILTRGIEGLKPKVKKHEFFVEVDPKMGIPVGGKSRLQLNIMGSKVYGTPSRNSVYKDQVAFPITWMDYGVDRLPDDLSAMIRSLLSFIKVAEFALSYGFIFASIVLAVFFFTGCRQKLRTRHRSANARQTRNETLLVEVVHEKR